MKKKALFAFVAASLMMSAPLADIPAISAVYASEESTLEQIKQKIEKSKKVQLSLEEAITLAIEDNTNLARIYYSLKLLELNEESLRDRLADIESSISEIQSNISKMRNEISNLRKCLEGGVKECVDNSDNINEQIQSYEKSISSLNRQLISLYDNRDSLEAEIINLENQIAQNPLQRKLAEEGVRYIITATFAGLEQMQEGIVMQEKQLKQKQAELNKQKRLHQLGRLAKHEVTKAEREILSLQEEIVELKEKYDIQLKNLLLDLNIDPKNKEITLQPLNMPELKKVTQTIPTEKLIADNIEMQLLQKELETLEKQRNMTSGNLQEQYKVQIDLKNLEIKEKRMQLEKKINDLYLQAKQAYDALKKAERENDYAADDYHKLKKQYELGLISKHDYEQAAIMLDAAEMEYKNAQIQYYLITKQLEALERGFVAMQ